MKIILLILVFPFFVNAQSSFEKKITEAARILQCSVPSEKDPVMLNAKLVAEKDSVAVIVKVELARGWHIYQFVPSTLPYIAIEHVLQLPDGITAVGEWRKSEPMSSVNDPGVLIYETEAVFVQKLLKEEVEKKKRVIRAGLYYQTCNLSMCLPPVEKVFELALDK